MKRRFLYFLYARCAVVANGAAYDRQMLENPSDMPKDITFEALLYLSQKAFFRKTGKQMVYVPLFDYETYGRRRNQ